MSQTEKRFKVTWKDACGNVTRTISGDWLVFVAVNFMILKAEEVDENP